MAGKRAGLRVEYQGRMLHPAYVKQLQRAQALGFQNYAEQRAAQQHSVFRTTIAIFERAKGALLGQGRVRLSTTERRGLFDEYVAAGVHVNPADKSPTGPLAQYLVRIGMRNAGDTWNVGDTP